MGQSGTDGGWRQSGALTDIGVGPQGAIKRRGQEAIKHFPSQHTGFGALSERWYFDESGALVAHSYYTVGRKTGEAVGAVAMPRPQCGGDIRSQLLREQPDAKQPVGHACCDETLERSSSHTWGAARPNCSPTGRPVKENGGAPDRARTCDPRLRRTNQGYGLATCGLGELFGGPGESGGLAWKRGAWW